MRRISRSTVVVFLCMALLSACSKVPDHARYIPKDAVAVIGVNLKSLSKKVAWNMITGSKLFKEMQNRIPEKTTKDAMLGIEKAGIDALNSFYVYVKTDARFTGGNRVTGLVPLADAAQWETYVKQVFPQVVIKQANGRKEASLGLDMYVAWNDHLLVIINTLARPAEGAPQGADLTAGLTAEMDNAFGVTAENSVTANKHFTKVNQEGHDMMFWLNYDQLMSQYSGDMAEKMGMSLSGALWKDAAFTAGFDFKKGRITGDMRYYMADEMKEIGTELGATNADKDMLERLPSQNMDMLLAMHISPKGIKSILEKTGLLGLANIALNTQEGMSVDHVLDAFTGDMAITMNDFSLKTEIETDSFMGQAVQHMNQKPSLSLSYVIKLNKKENFQKMLKIAKENGLQPMGNNFVIPLSTQDSVYIMLNDQYLVASNKYVHATGILNGDFKAQKMPEAMAKEVMGHPVAMYMDIQQLFKNIDAGINRSAHDSVMIVESKKLLNNISVNGGSFKDNAFEYHLDINFMNPDENSIIELMDYGMRMSDADKIRK